MRVNEIRVNEEIRAGSILDYSKQLFPGSSYLATRYPYLSFLALRIPLTRHPYLSFLALRIPSTRHPYLSFFALRIPLTRYPHLLSSYFTLLGLWNQGERASV